MLFAVVATANGAGYRFGVSDQAFYVPAVLRALDSSTFPRDAALIDAQSRLILTDELLAAIVRVTGSSIDTLFFAGYVLSSGLIWLAIVLIGSRVYSSRWTIVALGAALTLRHRIARTSANSFEPYFHPRMLAFAFGLLALAAVLRRRTWTAVILIAGAGVVHSTTAMWCGVTVGVALIAIDARIRRLALPATIAAIAIATWAIVSGPLHASFVRMDDAWLQAVASKDSLFATEWPLWVWIANLGMLGILWWAHRRRVALERATAEDRAIVWGTTALVVVFLVTLPLVAARMAFPVQMQISRVFWMVDIVATIYVLAAFVDQRPKAIAMLLVAIAAGRGLYVMTIERPDRSLFELHLAASPWHDAMRWLQHQPPTIHVLADPGHGWKYGTSVRVSAARDVFLEDQKDSAIAIYSREVALRVNERAAAVADFDALTPERATALSQQYGLDFLVTTHDLPLPLRYENDQFHIYALGEARPGGRHYSR